MRTTIGQAYKSMLSPRQRKALKDMAEPGIMLAPGSYTTEYLPPQFRLAYTRDLVTRFLVCVLTVAWKLSQPRPKVPLLSCTGEELAAWAVIHEAQALLDEENQDFSAFESRIFEDFDVLTLFDPALDGFENIPGVEGLVGHAGIAW